MGVVAPWRLALWEHSACSLPVVLLISRAGGGSLGKIKEKNKTNKKPKKKATGAAKKAAAAAKARE